MPNPLIVLCILLLVLLCVGAFPAVGLVPHGFGYYPSGVSVLLLVLIVVLFLR